MADFGSEFRKELDIFLTRYNIQLISSKPFAKGSTGSAEQAIRLLKGGLRQLCLANTSHWYEMVPLLIQGLNATGIYGTSTTRQQLYFSPFSYANKLHLDGLLWPEVLFNQNYERLKFIITRRKKNLQQRSNMDNIVYQEGNLVLATNHPITPSEAEKGKSQELRLTTRGIYYVKRVLPAHLRLVGLFSGEERNLPREFVTKITLSNLVHLQTFLQSHQLAKVANNLFKANKYLSPDQQKTWRYLLSKNQNRDFEEIDDDSQDFALQNDQHSESAPSESPPAGSPDLLPQATVPGLCDPPPTDQLDFARRRHRSGQAFRTLTAPRKPILKLPSALSPPQNSQPFACPPVHNKCGEQCCTKLSNKHIDFSEKLSIRFIHSGNNFEDFSQTMLTHPISGQDSTTFLMLSAIGVESSSKELFYRATWSSPNDTNAKINTQVD